MRSDLLILILIIIADAVLLLEIVYFILRRSTSNRLIRAAFENNEAEFTKASASLGGKLLSDFDKKLIRFNVAEIRRDDAIAEALIKEFEKKELTTRQKKQICPKIFYHYIDHKKTEDAARYYEMLKDIPVYPNKKDVEMTYDTYIRKGHGYLEEALKSLNRISKQDLPARERLIAKMYENKGIRAEAKKYANLADQHEARLKESRRK